MNKNKLQIGIIGCGGITKEMHLPALKQQALADVVALCDADPGRLQSLADEARIERVYSSPEELIEDPEVQAVVIALPPKLNKDIAICAANGKKHIVLEKPIAITLEDANEIIENCKRNGVTLCVNHQMRFSACDQMAKQLIGEGVIGELTKVMFEHYADGLQAYRQLEGWLADPDCGGVWISWGVHHTDLLRFLTGDNVERVYAEIGSTLRESDRGEDSVFAIVRMESGIVGEIQISTVCCRPRESIDNDFVEAVEKVEISGSQGSIIYSRQAGRMEVYSTRRGDPQRTSFAFGSNQKGYSLNMIEMQKLHYERLIPAILEQRKVPVSGEDAYKALEIIVAGYESAKTNRAVFISELT